MALAFDADYGPRTNHALDPRNDSEGGWEGCAECNATGVIADELCERCGGCGGNDTATGEPITFYEYERQQQRARDDRHVD